MKTEDPDSKWWDRILERLRSVPGKIWTTVTGAGIEGIAKWPGALVRLLAAVLVLVVVCYLLRWAISPPEGIVVLPFENNTGIAEYDIVAQGIVDSLIVELQDIGRIHMIKARGPETVRIMQAEKIELPIMGGTGAVEESLREIDAIKAGDINVPVGSLLATIKTLFSGSGKTISGSIQKSGSTIRIVARLDENGQRGKAWEVSGLAIGGAELTGLIEELAFKICWEQSGEITANSWESFRHFTYGLENSRLYELSEATEDAYAYKAIRNFEAAANIQPGYARAHYNLGVIYYDLGECTDTERKDKATCEQALEEFEKATEADPAFRDAYYNLGVTYDTPFFNREMAVESYSKAISLDPNYAEAYRSRGLIYLEQQEYNKAIYDFGRLINLKPNDTEGYVLRGSTYRTKADFEQAEADGLLNLAIDDFSRVVDLDADWAEAHYNRGCVYIDAERYDDAIDDLSAAIDLEPSYAEAYNARGRAYSTQGDQDSAIADFTQAIALDPARPAAYASRAIAYRSLGDDSKSVPDPVKAATYFGMAIADYTTAIELDPSVSSFHYDRGISYKALWDVEGRNEEDPNRINAILDFEKFLELREDPLWRVKAGDQIRELQGETTIAGLDGEIQENPDNIEAFYQLGIAYASVQVYDKAIANFDRVIELEPEYALAYLQRGIAYTKLDPPEEGKAIADFTRVMGMDETEAEAYRQCGLIYERQAQRHNGAGEFEEANEDYTEAIAAFGHVIRIRSDDVEAYRHRAEDHYYMGLNYVRISDDPLKARTLFLRAISDLTQFITFLDHTTLQERPTKTTDEVWAHNLRGSSYFEVETYPQAITDFSEAIDLQLDASLYYNRGNVYYRLEEYQEAIEDYDKAIELDPNNAAFYYKRGSAYEFVWEETKARQGEEMKARQHRETAIQDLQKAASLGYDISEEQLRRLREGERTITELDQMIAENPENADAYYLRGVARAGQGKHELAIEDFNKVIELQPDHGKAFCNRGLAHSYLGQQQQAVEDFTRSIELGMEDAEVYRDRGQAHLALGNRRQAIDNFDQVIKLEPTDAKAYLLRGTVYSDLGDYKPAIDDFEKAIECNPNDVEALYRLGIAHIELRDYSEAFAHFRGAIELDPLDARAYNGLGIAYTNLEDYPHAITYLDRAIKLNPAYGEAYYRRGVAHQVQGNNELAIQDFERVLQMSEDPYWQRLAEEQLGDLRQE